MSILQGRQASRGTSIVAALVFVAILAVVGLAFESLNVDQNSQSMTAIGSGAVSSGQQNATAAAQAKLQVPDCSTITNNPNVVTAQNENSAQATPVCTCTKTANNVQKFFQVNYQVKAVLQSGAAAAATVRSVGAEVASNSKGECKVTTCKAWGSTPNACTEASSVLVLPGQLNSTLNNAAQTSVGMWAQDTVQAAAAKQITLNNIGPTNAVTTASINNAFSYLTSPTYMNPVTGDAAYNTAAIDPNSPQALSVADQLKQMGQCGGDGQAACPASSPASLPPVQLTPDNTAGAPTGGLQPDATCTIGGLSGVGCSNSSPNPNEIYPASQDEINAAKTAGYTCGEQPGGEGGGTMTVCTKSTTNIPPPNAGCPTCKAGPAAQQPQGSGTLGSGTNSALNSLLSGLAKGLASSLGAAAAQPCSTNSTVYAQQQQQYQTQLQQYQIQLQQYQLQMQINANNGNTIAPTQPIAPTPCSGTSAASAPYGTGTDGTACAAPPAQPDPAQCTVGTWRATSGSGNGCTTGWQCIPGSGSGVTPTAQISCQPQVADVGMSLAISYSCTNATVSVGSGFTTNGAVSGSATTTIAAPPAGTNTATYGITCTNQGLTSSAQCSVQISTPSIVLIANPQHVASGGTSSLGWITGGMQSCTISSPSFPSFNSQNASNTSVNGVATTPALTGNTEFDLNCTTAGGQAKSASTTVVVGDGSVSAAPAQSGNLTVGSTADGNTVNHGDTIMVTWQDTGTPPSNSAVSLWLIDAQTGNATALIAGQQTAGGGTYTWNLPNVGDTCDSTSPAPCASNLVAGDEYGLEAALYTPANAYLGGSTGTSNPAPNYVDYAYSPNVFTVGQ